MSTNKISPIFILSLPRSGSTLLQRILSVHPEISSVSEPWLLLPFFYALEREGSFTEYSHTAAQAALNEFIEKLPNGLSDYYDAINDASSALYAKVASGGSRYFIDKTPRYSLISNHLIRAFPDAKFIFLWRNPLSVLASINETWGEGHWLPYGYKIDLYAGFDRLFDACQEAKDRSVIVNYEKLVKDPEAEVRRICSYLDIPYTSALVRDFSTTVFSGRFGDPTGVKKYTNISSSPVSGWKKVLNSRYRVRWAKRYLSWIGTERVHEIGYEMQDVINDLNSLSAFKKFGVCDMLWGIYGNALCYLESSLFKQKLKQMTKWWTVYKHD